MNILVFNTGSSSVKFTLFRDDNLKRAAHGKVERIGLDGTLIQYENERGDQIEKEISITDTRAAINLIAELLNDPDIGDISENATLTAIGHRVVHGGERINAPEMINQSTKEIIKACFPLAPLHNPVNLSGIEACEKIFPDIPQVAVFDTAFHADLPEHAYLYGIPYQLYSGEKIRKYGFHGTSHQYVSRKTAKLMKKPIETIKMVTCHLGNGCSLAAVDGGRCVDTTMGFTPLEGLMMGTRCGDLDPAIVFYLMEQKNLEYHQVNDLLNKKSGLLGLAGVGSSDLRDIFRAKESGNRQAEIAICAFIYRIKKYLGAYIFAMGNVDAVIFTGGIGENLPAIREGVCKGLAAFGITIDTIKNERVAAAPAEIQNPISPVKIWVIPTNEEKEIARQTVKVINA